MESDISRDKFTVLNRSQTCDNGEDRDGGKEYCCVNGFVRGVLRYDGVRDQSSYLQNATQAVGVEGDAEDSPIEADLLLQLKVAQHLELLDEYVFVAT